MIHFLADENFDNKIVRGLMRRVSSADAEFTRVQDTEIEGEPDPKVLDYAFENEMVLLTHNVNTIRGLYYEKLSNGENVPAIFLIHSNKAIGDVLDSLELIVLTTELEDWSGQLHYIPL